VLQVMMIQLMIQLEEEQPKDGKELEKVKPKIKNK
jgi:hypothetical protein